MQFITNPTNYSSAFSEATYLISATPSEVVDIEVYDNSFTKIIGKKRFTGQAQYHVNIANYAKRQINVTPLRPSTTSIEIPSGRIIGVRVKCGVARTVFLTSAIETIQFHKKLSNAPDRLKIAPLDRYEYSILNNDNTVSTKIEFVGNKGTKTITLAPSTLEFVPISICINMKDLNNKLLAIGAKVSDFHTMRLSLTGNYDPINLIQTFDIVGNRADEIRICWWNQLGHIDHYTMRRIKEESISTKQRIYTAEGYKTIGSSVDNAIEMVSEYENSTIMNWLKEIIGSPSAWIDSQLGLIPIEITTTAVTTKSEELSRLELRAVHKLKTIYQNI